MAQNFRDLIASQKAMRLAKSVYVQSETFPKHQLFGLTQQLQRAAVSVPSNIAEGHARHSSKDFLRFLSMARGSLVQTQLMLANDLDFLSKPTLDRLMEDSTEVYKLLNGLYSSITKRVSSEHNELSTKL